ncbi:arsenate reductase (glutaredoxin) [Flavobacterium capsici]|uniref:Arsenate reductase (Glutaredoxin) n=1 Tax=Flavobacterium capsici TaxID=3075618 RepID=A0AA96F1F1_9FLAO|nr:MULTISPECIES: arsenate reductase (glutaredoxin) [unclassified Flavobacterium]WNM18287.1 arsenate reductase (glutaredoxin) [Flavobacterium sp. PMR2A8]WNM22338.1 arsenate reductase (glutaredoxin) [Flavobacterium sp. PMTSA4]
MKILHNPRCGKSRQCLAFLENNHQEFTIIKYLENPLSINEIKNLLKKLNLPAIELVRTKESIWIDNYKSKKMTKEEIIKAIADNPILMERPIVIKDNKAFIARDNEKLNLLI